MSLAAAVTTAVDSLLPPGWQGQGALSAAELIDFRARFRQAMITRGWLAPTWPVRYGGANLSHSDHRLLVDSLMTRGIRLHDEFDTLGISLLGNTMLKYCSKRLLDRHLPGIVSGTVRWCQGFSEPEAGSDLAAVSASATLAGDHWLVNGQKVWSSLATEADWIFMLVRTDALSTRHKGLSMLLVPTNQPGIEIRPIRNLVGSEEFCEIFFTDARAQIDSVVGNVGDGWAVAMTMLAYERGETAKSVPAEFEEEFSRLLNLAVQSVEPGDAAVAQRLADAYVSILELRCSATTIIRALDNAADFSTNAALFKLSYTEHHRKVTELAMDLLDARALGMRGRPTRNAFRSDDPGTCDSELGWASVFLTARAGTIYAGTSEIQRNIIAERLLRLPKD